MSFLIADRVKETTTTTGTGAVTLAGAVTGFDSFASIGNGNSTYYCIENTSAGEWEVGIGTYTASGTTLSRTTVLSSSNADALVSFSAGIKEVFVTAPAVKLYTDDSVHAATSKNSPIDADEIGIWDSVSAALRKLTWANLKATLSAGMTFTGLLNLANGADIASASTVDLTAATGNTVRITGTTAITAFTMNAGQQMELVAVGALPLTYNATTMNINGGASYTCAAGDRLSVFKDGAGVVTVNVTKQDGSAVVASGLPAGTVIHLASSSTPSGYLKANGALVSRTTYANLFAAIGTTFGVGDGSTTFALPDLRGEFIRGWADNRAVDTGRAFGSAQADDNKSHAHTASVRADVLGGAGSVRFIGSDGGGVAGTTTAINTSGGTEARPRNIALLACIKY